MGLRSDLEAATVMEGRRVNLASISWVSVRKSIASLRCCLLVSIRSGAQSDSHFQREHCGLVWAENKKIDGIGCVDSVREGITAHSAGRLRHLGSLLLIFPRGCIGLFRIRFWVWRQYLKGPAKVGMHWRCCPGLLLVEALGSVSTS